MHKLNTLELQTLHWNTNRFSDVFTVQCLQQCLQPLPHIWCANISHLKRVKVLKLRITTMSNISRP